MIILFQGKDYEVGDSEARLLESICVFLYRFI